jgi:uncharacterized protein (TIGR03067 family)
MLSLFACLMLVAADTPEKKSDKELIQGTWVFVAMEADGKEVKDGILYESVKEWKLTLKDGSLRNAKEPDYKATYTLDPDKKPPVLSVVIQSQNNMKGVMLYELKGDSLKLCVWPSREDEQPKAFDSKDGRLIFSFKREKSADK